MNVRHRDRAARALLALVIGALATTGFARSKPGKAPEAWAIKALVTTPVIRGGEPARKISVDVTGLTELWLQATVGRDDYHHDRAAWGGPVLIDKAGNRVDVTMLTPVSAVTGWGKRMLNRGLAGPPLRIGKQTFRKGWFAHAPSAIRYKDDADGRKAPDGASRRVVRSGSWYDRPKRCRSAFRLSCRPYQKVYDVGFRAVIED